MKVERTLTNLQLELIKMFQYELADHQLVEIKELLAKYFADKASDEMDRLWEQRNWSNKTMDDWSNEHLRSSDE